MVFNKKKRWHCLSGQPITEMDKQVMYWENKGKLVPTRELIKTPEQIEGIRKSGVVNTQDMNPRGRGLPQGRAEGGVRGIVGVQVQNRPHLDNKQGIALAALGHCSLQAAKMLCSPLRGRIREGADAAILQRNTLNLQIALLVPLPERKVKPGVPMGRFRPQVRNLPQATAQ